MDDSEIPLPKRNENCSTNSHIADRIRKQKAVESRKSGTKLYKSAHYVYRSHVVTVKHTLAFISQIVFNPQNPELNPIYYFLALLGAYHFIHVSRIRVKSLTLRLLMSYIYGAPILDVSRSHTTTQHSR